MFAAQTSKTQPLRQLLCVEKIWQDEKRRLRITLT